MLTPLQDLELSLKIDDSTIPRRSPRRRRTGDRLQSVPNEPSGNSQHTSTNNTGGGRLLSDSDAVQLLEVLHQSRDGLLASSVSGKHPDKEFWASCLEKVNEKLGRRAFATWSDLKSWVKAHSGRQRERGIIHAPQTIDNSAKQMLIYEWLWYWTYWELMVHAAKFHDSVIEVFGRGKLIQMLQGKYNIADGETNFMPFILNDVTWMALEARKKRLERPFRKTRSYSRFPGESDEEGEDRAAEDDDDSSEEWTSPMEDPNPMTSIETEQPHEDGEEGKQNNDDDGQDGAEINDLLGTQPTPRTMRRLKILEDKFREQELFRSANHDEMSRNSTPLPPRLDTPEVFRDHSQEPSLPKAEHRSEEYGDNGTGNIDGHEDWQDQYANSELQCEQQGDTKVSLLENRASTSTPPSPGDLSMSQNGCTTTSNSPLLGLVTSDISPPKPFAEILGSPILHSRQIASSPNPFDESDDPFDESHDIAPKNLSSSSKLQRSQSYVRKHEKSATEIPAHKTQGAMLNRFNYDGTPPVLRQENEAHARKQLKRVRTSFAPVGQLKAMLVPHTIQDTDVSHEEPSANFSEPAHSEISTRMFYGSPVARWPVTKSHFQFMGTHTRFADDHEPQQDLRGKGLVHTAQQYGVQNNDTSLTKTTLRSPHVGSADAEPLSGKQAKAVKKSKRSVSSTIPHPQADYSNDEEDSDASFPPLEAIFRNRPGASPQATTDQSVPKNLSPKNLERKSNQHDKRRPTDQINHEKPAQNESPSASSKKHQLKQTPKDQRTKQLCSSSMDTSDERRSTDGISQKHGIDNADCQAALGMEHDSSIEGAASQPAQAPKEKKSSKSKAAKRKRSQSRAREAVNKQAPGASGLIQEVPAIAAVEETGNTYPSKRHRAESRPLSRPEPSSIQPQPVRQSSKKRGKRIFQEVTPSPLKLGGYNAASEKAKALPQSHFIASPGGSCPNPTSRSWNWSRGALPESSPGEDPFASPFASKQMDTFLGESVSLSSQRVIEHRTSYHNPTPAQEPLHDPEPQSSPSMTQHPRQSEGHANNRRSEPCTPQPRTYSSISSSSRPSSGLFIRSNLNTDNRYRSTPYNGSPSNKSMRRNNRHQNNRGRNSYTQQSRFQRSMTVDTNTALLNATPGSRHLGETIVQMEARLQDIRRHGETLVLMEAELQDMKRQFRRMNSNR